MSTDLPTTSLRRAERISGPAELIQAVPYLLGFHPLRSVVFVGLDSRILVGTARLDLDDAEPELIAHTFDALTRGGATSLVVAIYDDDAAEPAVSPELPHQMLVDLLDDAAAELRCDLVDVVLVADGRWWPLTCDSGCGCPPEGRELLSEPSPFAAAATIDGVVALPDRAAVEALLEPFPDHQRNKLHAQIEKAEHAAVQAVLEGRTRRHAELATRAVFAAARDSKRAGWSVPADDDVVRFGVALTSIAVRDPIWVAVDDGRLDGRPLWRELARRLPSPYDAAPLFLFGWASWRSGSGALAGIAGERAIESDPGYTAADLLLAAVAHGVNPRHMPTMSGGRRARQ